MNKSKEPVSCRTCMKHGHISPSQIQLVSLLPACLPLAGVGPDGAERNGASVRGYLGLGDAASPQSRRQSGDCSVRGRHGKAERPHL